VRRAALISPPGRQLSRAYALLRDMGLRHLPVLNSRHAPIGMLTRANFSRVQLHRAVKEFYVQDEVCLVQPRRMPRLRMSQLIDKQRSRAGLASGSEGRTIGGPLDTWQARLAADLGRLRTLQAPSPSPRAERALGATRWAPVSAEER